MCCEENEDIHRYMFGKLEGYVVGGKFKPCWYVCNPIFLWLGEDPNLSRHR